MPLPTVIVYPAGSHGNFLAAALNELTGVAPGNLVHETYDDVSYQQTKNFYAVHFIHLVSDLHLDKFNIINIDVGYQSYLKYSAVCFNRAPIKSITAEELDQDTFKKLKTHKIFQHLVPSLIKISGQDSGNVSKKYLREWARICWFADQGKTITHWLRDTYLTNADYHFDYEWFYDNTIFKTKCQELLTQIGHPIIGSVDHMMPDFIQNNRYRNIDHKTSAIIDAIIQKKDIEIVDTNFIQEAYIDCWLEDNYQIQPLLPDEYFSTTMDLIKAYNLET